MMSVSKNISISNRILRLPEVQSQTGLSRSSIYLMMSEGLFPASVKLGERSVGWVEKEIQDWINQKINI